ncbi:MAG: DUF5011 domain-containing protein [Desulfobacteraceae bacterium]|nr:DUF5011 domain-containing protein [Desulfobacteraceae bacterium]MBC2754190.1 DUF5011 domain-containing protein [Desulfobacteraceae bacterium]
MINMIFSLLEIVTINLKKQGGKKMKRVLFFLCLAVGILTATSNSFARDFVTINISGNIFSKSPSPQINTNGHVVWSGDDDDGSGGEIYYYNGSTVINLSNNPDGDDLDPQINGNGLVVWSAHDGSDSEIYLAQQFPGPIGISKWNISNNPDGDDLDPQVNGNGLVVWSGYNGSDYDIYRGNSKLTWNISNNPVGDDVNPQINGNGLVVWSGERSIKIGLDYEIYEGYFENDEPVKNMISANLFGEDINPQVNENCHMVWSGYTGSDYEIFYYDGSNVTNISNNPAGDDKNPQINADGHIVWSGDDGSGSEIYYYNGSTVTNISNSPDVNESNPQINSDGHVVWAGSYGFLNVDVYYFDGSSITNISNNPNDSESNPQINDFGYVVWVGSSMLPMTTFRIYLAIPFIADAGSDQLVSGGDQVTLESQNNAFADTYSWAQVEGTSVDLTNTASPSVTFDAPGTVETLTFELTVTDMDGYSTTDTVFVTVLEDVNNAIFVSSDMGNDSNLGTPESPVQSIEKAMQLAVDSEPANADIYIEASSNTYFLTESLLVEDDVSIYGGFEVFGASWSRTTSEETRIYGPAIALKIENINSPTVIDGLTIESADGADGEEGIRSWGENSIPIYLKNVSPSNLIIRNNKILAGQGGKGRNGLPGLPGNPGGPGGHGDPWWSDGNTRTYEQYIGKYGTQSSLFGGDAGSGTMGIGGFGGGGGMSMLTCGFDGGDGYSSYMDKTSDGGPACSRTSGDFSDHGGHGDPGDPGDPGESGEGGGEEGHINRITKMWIGNSGLNGGQGDVGCGGGGGGAGRGLSGDTSPRPGGSGGGGGGGGSPGTGGLGGGGGGASIGIYFIDATAQVVENIITTAGGGNGGSGGSPSYGGSGGAGGDAGWGTTHLIFGWIAGCGGNGGNGACGGAGGGGGGGGGGISYPWFLAGDSVISPSVAYAEDINILILGPPGEEGDASTVAPENSCPPGPVGEDGEPGMTYIPTDPPKIPFDIPPGEIDGTNVAVPDGTSSLILFSRWPGSDVEMTLISPSGRIIGRDSIATDVIHTLGSTFEEYVISNPEAGTWEISLFGLDVPPGGEEVTLSIQTVPVNQIPVAIAGPDQIVEQNCTSENGTDIELDGTSSNDPEGAPLIFEWKDSEGNLIGDSPVMEATLAAGNYTFTLTVQDNKGASSTDSIDVQIMDMTPPNISLNGDSLISLKLGDSYTEEGAIAIDNCDMEVPVVIGGDAVDSGNAGTYTITYDAMDSAGNQANQRTRTVMVSGNPISNAGPDQAVCNSVVFDGTQSEDVDGTIVSYNWLLVLREDLPPDVNIPGAIIMPTGISVSGASPIVTDLEFGVYDVILTVTDNDGFRSSDSMVLTVDENICNQIDTDGDGIPDYEDNCPESVNSDQADEDEDGIGSACDVCPFIGEEDQILIEYTGELLFAVNETGFAAIDLSALVTDGNNLGLADVSIGYTVTDNSGIYSAEGSALSDASGLSQCSFSGLSPNVYTIMMTTEESGCPVGQAESLLVVFDPNVPRATGGGFIRPDGESTLPAQSDQDKANFGFIVKIDKNKAAAGNLEFQYKAAHINLKSQNMGWYTVSSNKAMFQGVATINGEGLYTFRVQATDGDLTGDQPDAFDIKIWLGTNTEADPYHRAKNDLAGGNIVVHKK